MSKLKTTQLVNAFSGLGEYLLNPDDQLKALIDSEHHYNAWFTPENVKLAVTSIGKSLNAADLIAWLSKYQIDTNIGGKKVGLILAGNIPLVGFHDVICVLASGNYALVKASAQDARLINHILNKLVEIEPAFGYQYSFVERLENFEAVIATGSNNTSRYFEYYFSKVPHIIRKNRNSVAVLTGNETEAELVELGHDIFDYYGLGCRNVSKLLIPKDYDFTFLFESIQSYYPIINHNKYNNNYDYNKSIYLVNLAKHLDNGFLLIKEDENWVSPLAVLFYEYYENIPAAEQKIKDVSDKIQCVVSTLPLQIPNQVVNLGMSQQPALWDYADGIDTMDFLSNLYTFEGGKS